MVMVLPWHDPVRVAEEIAWLDTVSGGRTVLGLGRGLGSIEFDNFRLDMGESRQRFVEYATAISDSLETGVLTSDGDWSASDLARLDVPVPAELRSSA